MANTVSFALLRTALSNCVVTLDKPYYLPAEVVSMFDSVCIDGHITRIQLPRQVGDLYWRATRFVEEGIEFKLPADKLHAAIVQAMC